MRAPRPKTTLVDATSAPAVPLRPKNVRASYITVATACLALTGIASAQAPAAPAAPAATPAPAAPTGPTVAPAAPPPAAEPTQEQRDAARDAYTRGQALFAQSKYEEALVAFEQAYAAVPNPVVLLSLAECSVRLGKLDEAEATFQRYLSARPDAPDRADIEAKIAELRATPSILALNTKPTGAAVKLDGVDTGKVTPVELTVTPGSHRVDVALAGHLPLSESVEIKIGGRHELQIALQPAPAAPPPEPVVKAPAPPPPAPRDSDPTAALWVTSIVGAAGLVTGTVLGFMVLAERSDYDASPTEASADRGERLALFADVAFGVGAMALITGAVLYLTDDSSDEPERETARLRLREPGVGGAAPARSGGAASEPVLTVVPLAGPKGAGLTARVRY
jgi:tetratricopeptide (TPR) repeat protein